MPLLVSDLQRNTQGFQLLAPAGVTLGIVRHWEGIPSALSPGLELSMAAGACPDIPWCLLGLCHIYGCITELILALCNLQLGSSCRCCCLEGICHPTRAPRTPPKLPPSLSSPGPRGSTLRPETCLVAPLRTRGCESCKLTCSLYFTSSPLLAQVLLYLL